MMNVFTSRKKSFFLSAIIFLFITVIFLNYTHNSINSIHLEKTSFQENDHNTFIKLSNDEIKKKLSENFTNDESYKIITERECTITGDFHDRHKVRWLKALFLKKIFNITYDINEKFPYYLNIVLHSLLIFLSLYVLNKTFNLGPQYSLIFLLYVTFIFQQHLSEYSYSIFEMFFLSLSLYSSKNKKYFLFLLSCVLAVLNRESGFLIIFTWLIFNSKDYKKIVYFFLTSSLIFVLVNFDILKCLLEPKFFVPLEKQQGQVNISDIPKINIISLGKLFFTNFFLPFGLAFYYLIISKTKNKILLSLLLIYLLIFIFATPLHHISVRLILLPLILTAIYFYELEKKVI